MEKDHFCSFRAGIGVLELETGTQRCFYHPRSGRVPGAFLSQHHPPLRYPGTSTEHSQKLFADALVCFSGQQKHTS